MHFFLTHWIDSDWSLESFGNCHVIIITSKAAFFTFVFELMLNIVCMIRLCIQYRIQYSKEATGKSGTHIMHISTIFNAQSQFRILLKGPLICLGNEHQSAIVSAGLIRSSEWTNLNEIFPINRCTEFEMLTQRIDVTAMHFIKNMSAQMLPFWLISVKCLARSIHLQINH